MKRIQTTDTAIIIPVYNEAEVIRSVVDTVSERFKYIVCVNDGSSDDTEEELKKTKATVVSHPINLGQGAALQTGIEFAVENLPCEYFATYDADGQHRLEDVEQMIKTIKQEKVDIVLGSRFLGEAKDITKLKKAVLKLAIIFSNSTSGIKLTDAHNGLRVFNRTVAERLNITLPDFSHASEIIERIASEKFSYKEVPVTINYTDYSRRKGQSVFNAVNIGLDVLLRRISK